MHEIVAEARNDLSDVIHTWNGTGIDAMDMKLFEELSRILDLLDIALGPTPDLAKNV